MSVKVTNNAYGTISAGITSTATTITLDGGQGNRFPVLGAGEYFYATLIDTSNNLEVVKVTARSTDSMTVTRGEDNTVARAFSIGDRFELRPTAALFEEFFQNTGGTISGGTTISAPSVPFTIDSTNANSYKLRFLDSSNTTTGYLGSSVTLPFRVANSAVAEVLSFDSNGYRKEAERPYFSAYNAATTTQNWTGTGGTWLSVASGLNNWQATKFAEYVDNGGHFDNSNGRFTAPVSGYYLIDFWMCTYVTAVNTSYMTVMQNGSPTGPYNIMYTNTTSSAQYAYHSVSRTMFLAANDYVEPGGYAVTSGAGSNNWSIPGSGYLYFAGRLLSRS